VKDTAPSSPAEFIPPAPIEELIKAANEGSLDPSSTRLKQAEQAYIRRWREARGDAEQAGEPEHLVGLALSGGGIRSATFALGVLQALAHRGLLSKVDYLSTVSGGGYIGSALTWLLSDRARNRDTECEGKDEEGRARPCFSLEKEEFPYGADDPGPDAERHATDRQKRMLRYLREHGYYLSPGKGITLVSLIGVVLRGTALNLMVWLSLLVLFFSFGIWAFARLGLPDPPILSLLLPEPHTNGLFGFELFLWLTIGIAAGLTVGIIVYSALTYLRRDRGERSARLWYYLRRSAEKAAILLPIAVTTLLVGILPVIAVRLDGWLQAAGPAAVLSGVAMLLRHFVKATTSNAVLPLGAVVSVGAALFLYGVLLVSFQAAFLWVPGLPVGWEALVIGALLVLALGTGWFVNLNYISIHRYYRDRLMESYMPDIDSALANRTGAALGADGVRLSEFGGNGPGPGNMTGPQGQTVVQGDSRDKPRGPLHLINTNVVLVNSTIRAYEERGGDNFILSPLYCGSNATGWCSTCDFMEGKMTLPTAVAISAAALNPNTGVGGEGITRNPLLSLVMYLLNLHIGYWATHPNPQVRAWNFINHFMPAGIYIIGSVLGGSRWLGFRENRPYLRLTDGGHFENTGVYELVRRRMKLIIVVDGGADPDFSFSDFQTTVRRIEDDFGARLEVVDGASPDEIVPVPVPREASYYPKKAEFAKQGHMLGRLTYADGTEAKVIYLKTTLTEDVSFKVKGYAAQHPTFPDESTADQFFDEVQFESYRELGFRLADKMLQAKVPVDGQMPPDGQTFESLIRECCRP
jgi:predicted acylesterase/phospholipase RssA